MPLVSLSSRAILGEFARTLETPVDHGFINDLTHYVPDSNQFKEEHHFLGALPGFIEWTGTRRVKELTQYFHEVENKPFELTLSVYKDDVTFDKTGQVQSRIDQLGNANAEHWEELISPLINAGGSGLCYDGKYFFDTTHEEGQSGAMSNSITVDISDMPIDTAYKGTPTIPSAMQMAHAITKGVQQMYTFKNDRGKPINQSAKSFLIMVPVTFMSATQQALSQLFLAHGEQNPLKSSDFSYKLSVNPRLSWTDAFSIFRTDGLGGAKPLIRQEMGKPEFTYLDEKSDLFHHERRMEYGSFVRRGVGYGLWQHACKVTFAA